MKKTIITLIKKIAAFIKKISVYIITLLLFNTAIFYILIMAGVIFPPEVTVYLRIIIPGGLVIVLLFLYLKRCIEEFFC